MSYIVVLLSFVCVCISPYSLAQGQLGVSLISNKEKELNIKPNVTLQFYLTSIHQNVAHVVFQAHTQFRNITVSTTAEPTYSTSVNGSHVGVLTSLHKLQDNATWYVTSWNDADIHLVVIAVTYSSTDPVPGGCNQEFNLQVDPNLNLAKVTTDLTVLQYPHANVAYNRDPKLGPPVCESIKNNLTYELYELYITERDLSELAFTLAIKKMLTVGDVLKNGRKLISLSSSDKANLSMVTYPGQGVVWTVLVTQLVNTTIHQAVYVPMASYACNFESNENGCNNIDTAWTWIAASFSAVVGIFICFLGHRHFKTELFIFGGLTFTLIFFIVFSIATDISGMDLAIATALFALLGAVLWLTFWWYCGLAVFSVLLVALLFGYLVASTLFFTPFGNIPWWRSNLNYGMTFACAVLILPVIFLYWTKTLNIISCAVVGSYGFVAGVSMAAHGSLAYIVVNSVKSAVVHDFIKAIPTTPFQYSDIILCAVWGILAIVGLCIQLYTERHQPDFPPCPYKMHKQKREEARRQQHLNTQTERSPLLEDAVNIQYGGLNSPSYARAPHLNEIT
ncbi:transmembrane 7 superfamily member 3 [Lingula anatina]|uniref:Transmembrane 7 superfamily member 3 n=1 Tax=Lingula anatina TaxID=7574 RepID=A0A1S3KEQ5_LINAN|nr:transmembrane 7 superfamily member 3 [Lingula anatina]|eukprot:XP_013420726.1 transmembrane 7 superfamily member 3 [Lingula anatina]